MTDRFDSLLRILPSVSRETFRDIVAFESEFLRWNKAINLIASSEALWERHILDSAQLVRLKPRANVWADMGSGSGFPAIVVALLNRQNAGFRMTMVESNRKKAGYLAAMVGQFGLNAMVCPARVETEYKTIGKADIVTARALAPLPKLLELCSPWLETGSVGLFHKGRDHQSELRDADSHWQFDVIQHPSQIASDSVVLEIANLRKR